MRLNTVHFFVLKLSLLHINSWFKTCLFFCKKDNFDMLTPFSVVKTSFMCNYLKFHLITVCKWILYENVSLYLLFIFHFFCVLPHTYTHTHTHTYTHTLTIIMGVVVVVGWQRLNKTGPGRPYVTEHRNINNRSEMITIRKLHFVNGLHG